MRPVRSLSVRPFTTFLIALLLWPVTGAAQTPAFFAPAEPSGSITVRLYPMENVTTSAPRLVTFGVPFPRGSVTAAGLATLRVLRGGAEVPAFVEALTPWRHITQPSLDGTSVRVARVQIQHAFTARYPGFEEVIVEWGATARTQNVAVMQDPRSAWHAVTTGSFVAADGVTEPDVYAVLPGSHLSKGALRPMRMTPMPASVPEAREDPAAMDAIATWPGFEEMDHAAKNNLYTVINEDDPSVTNPQNLNQYKTEFDTWLYDRSSTMFVVYMRSGYLKPLREAVRNTEFYRRQLYPQGTLPQAAVGCFKMKNPDPGGFIGGNGGMYAYNEPLAYTYWLTGDTVASQSIPLVVNCHEMNDEPMRWRPPPDGWSERHTAFRLLANVVAYEVFGNTAERNRIVSGTEDYIWHQNGADGQIPTNRVDGALWHPLVQGEGDPPPNGDRFQASPWKSALVVDAMVRAYAVTESSAIGHFVRRMGTFLVSSTKIVNDTEMDYFGREVDYITYIDGTSYLPEPTTHHHALEVAASLAWADYFGRLLGQNNASVAQAVAELYATYDFGVNYWIRPAAPPVNTAYRISPPRRWAWEHRVSGSLSWTFSQSAPQPPAGLNAVSIAGNTVTLAWTAPSEGPTPTGYVLEGGILAGQVLASIPTGSAAPSFTFVAPSGRFYVRLHATAAGQRSAASNEIYIAVNVPMPPAAPNGLRGLTHGSVLGLSWVNAAATELVRLNVTGAITTSLMLPAAESFTYTGVPPGTYSFAVQGYNEGGGFGGGSNTVTLTFPGACAGAPDPPAGLLITTAGRTITVSWNQPPAGTAVTQYTILVSGAFTGAIPLPARTISGTVGPGSYTISVTASNPCGTSAATPAQTVTIS